jgi:hypothetical protein
MRCFQGFLQEHYTLVNMIFLPNWWLNQDNLLTVWEQESQELLSLTTSSLLMSYLSVNYQS